MKRWTDRFIAEPGNKRNKYGAKRENRAGRSFASKAEASLFDYLEALHKDGELTLVACQKHVKLSDAEILYICDFVIERDGETIYVEMKGFETDAWRIKKKLWTVYGPGKLEIYKVDRSQRIFLAETIIPKK